MKDHPQAKKLSVIISTMPDKPGVYRFFDDKDVIIYIGKAKSLRKRVSSYFTRGQNDFGKTRMLVSRIVDIKCIVVETEMDALLLENNLIKKHQPRYNVLLKDDKTYPWICIKKENFPRIFSTRKMVRDGSTYFGPYANVKMVNTLLDLINNLYQLRNCNYQLTEENIEKKKFKVCLEYHIGNCLGPCEAFQSEIEYNIFIKEIREILKGNINSVIAQLREIMLTASDKVEFEKAHIIKEKIVLLEKFKSKSIVVNPAINNVDIFSIIKEGNTGYVNFMKVMNGAIMQSHTLELRKKLDETESELLTLAIGELRTRYDSDSPEIIANTEPDIELPGVTITIPKIGDKKHLLELGIKNLRYYIKEKHEQYEKLNPGTRARKLMEKMKSDLRLPKEPVHIECFDNSNIQGEFPVAAMSVFRNGKPYRKDYRHFNIKTVTGPNDFASMEEVIHRRYKRLLSEGQDLPQLVIVDGGKGQLSSAVKSFDRLGLRGQISILGIAKRLEELYYPDDSVPLYLDKKSETLRIIQQMRDEAHRFGITHHRLKRSKAVVKTELSNIQGVGEATSQKLLQHFKSVKKIREANLDEIASVVGMAKAKTVYGYFRLPK